MDIEVDPVAVVTGATGRIGFHVAKELAELGYHVVLACRSIQSAEEVKRKILEGIVNWTPQIDVIPLDLESFASIHAFADELSQRVDHVALLVNNAGVLQDAYRQTEDGFESTLQVNYLGHVLLTYRLLPLLTKTPDIIEGLTSRVVGVSSLGHRMAKQSHISSIGNLGQDTEEYHAIKAYNTSKLAVILFARKLHQLLWVRDVNTGILRVTSLACHPGITNDGPQTGKWSRVVTQLFGHSSEDASDSIMVACTMDFDSNGYWFIGPKKLGHEYSGDPSALSPSKTARNSLLMDALWDTTNHLLGIQWDL